MNLNFIVNLLNQFNIIKKHTFYPVNNKSKNIIIGISSLYVIYRFYRYYRNKLWIYIPFINKRVLKSLKDITDKSTQEKTEIINNITKSINIDVHRIPNNGLSVSTIHEYLDILETHDTKYKLISGAIYDNDHNDYKEIMSTVYNRFAYTNPMHGDVFNSVVFMERNIITMIGHLLHNENPCGTITNGGTESLFLAVKTYRDIKNVNNPNLVVLDTVHCSIDKIGHYLGIEVIKVPTNKDHRADSDTILDYINSRTIVVILSAPSYAFGIMDEISEIAPILKEKKIPVHVDACLGGFIWMFQDYSEYYSFKIEGVTSISVCLHKYGYAHKGVSSIIYREQNLLEHQYFASNNWDGGLYISPSFLGSRSGGLVAQAWVAILCRGFDQYKKSSDYILKLASYTYNKFKNICEMFPLDLNIVSFSIGKNTYILYDYLVENGFLLNSLQNPPAIHLCITLMHNEKIINELYEHINNFIKNQDNIKSSDGLAPIYGMKSGIPVNSNEIMDLCLKYYLSSKYTK
jgi:sphinganine-1-phosphate aldolase